MSEEKKEYYAKKGADIKLLIGFIAFCVIAMAIYLSWDFVRPDLAIASSNFSISKLGTMLIALLFAAVFLVAYLLGKKIFPEEVKIYSEKIQIGTHLFVTKDIQQIANYMAKNSTIRFVYQEKKYEFCFKYYKEEEQKELSSFFTKQTLQYV